MPPDSPERDAKQELERSESQPSPTGPGSEPATDRESAQDKKQGKETKHTYWVRLIKDNFYPSIRLTGAPNYALDEASRGEPKYVHNWRRFNSLLQSASFNFTSEQQQSIKDVMNEIMEYVRIISRDYEQPYWVRKMSRADDESTIPEHAYYYVSARGIPRFGLFDPIFNIRRSLARLIPLAVLFPRQKEAIIEQINQLTVMNLAERNALTTKIQEIADTDQAGSDEINRVERNALIEEITGIAGTEQAQKEAIIRGINALNTGTAEEDREQIVAQIQAIPSIEQSQKDKLIEEVVNKIAVNTQTRAKRIITGINALNTNTDEEDREQIIAQIQAIPSIEQSQKNKLIEEVNGIAVSAKRLFAEINQALKAIGRDPQEIDLRSEMPDWINDIYYWIDWNSAANLIAWINNLQTKNNPPQSITLNLESRVKLIRMITQIKSEQFLREARNRNKASSILQVILDTILPKNPQDLSVTGEALVSLSSNTSPYGPGVPAFGQLPPFIKVQTQKVSNQFRVVRANLGGMHGSDEADQNSELFVVFEPGARGPVWNRTWTTQESKYEYAIRTYTREQIKALRYKRNNDISKYLDKYVSGEKLKYSWNLKDNKAELPAGCPVSDTIKVDNKTKKILWLYPLCPEYLVYLDDDMLNLWASQTMHFENPEQYLGEEVVEDGQTVRRYPFVVVYEK